MAPALARLQLLNEDIIKGLINNSIIKQLVIK